MAELVFEIHHSAANSTILVCFNGGSAKHSPKGKVCPSLTMLIPNPNSGARSAFVSVTMSRPNIFGIVVVDVALDLVNRAELGAYQLWALSLPIGSKTRSINSLSIEE